MAQYSKQLLDALICQKNELQSQVQSISTKVLSREVRMMRQEALGQGGMSSYLQSALGGMPFFLAPGNVGDINTVIWPFWFPTPMVTLAPSQTLSSSITISKVAAFVAVSFTKTVFLRTEPAPGQVSYQYLNPDDPAMAGMSQGLSFSWRDAQSTREFVDRTVSLDHYGNPRFPHLLPSPQLFLPNSQVEFQFTNGHPTSTLAVGVTFYGVRVRTDEAGQILSTVYGQNAGA